jgi:hypothetical protein
MRQIIILWPAVFTSVGSPNDMKFLRISDLCRNQYELLLNRLNAFQLRTYHRLGDKRQLKAQDVTAKLVRFDILRMVPKNILFCIKLTLESKIPRGRNKIWRTLHIQPNFHLTSHSQAQPRCLASSSPVAAVGRCAFAIPRAGSVASLPPRSACRRFSGRPSSLP